LTQESHCRGGHQHDYQEGEPPRPQRGSQHTPP
jgi:hypothetical protein